MLQCMRSLGRKGSFHVKWFESGGRTCKRAN